MSVVVFRPDRLISEAARVFLTLDADDSGWGSVVRLRQCNDILLK